MHPARNLMPKEGNTMNAINNLISIIRSNNNTTLKLAKAICKIHAVNPNTIKVWAAPTEEKTGEHTSVEFTGIHAKFDWHDHKIELNESFDGKIIVKYDDQKISEIYWAASCGCLMNITENIVYKSKAMSYICDKMFGVVLRCSDTSSAARHVALNKSISVGETTVYAEGSTVYTYKDGRKERVCGNTWDGRYWYSNETNSEINKIQDIIRKMFIHN
jgi:hypothetical protein